MISSSLSGETFSDKFQNTNNRPSFFIGILPDPLFIFLGIHHGLFQDFQEFQASLSIGNIDLLCNYYRMH